MNDCFAKPAPTPENALDIIFDKLQPIQKKQNCPIYNILGRICAQNIHAKCAVPAFANSAVDGYGVRMVDLAQDKLNITQKITAGRQGIAPPLPVHSSVFIMTGAPVPAGVDCIFMLEDCIIDNNILKITPALRTLAVAGLNIRPIGDDVALGDNIIETGETINIAKIGLLAGQNTQKLAIFKPLTIAIASSGNEIAQHNQLQYGELFDINRPLLINLCQKMGHKVLDLGVVSDNLADLQRIAQTKCDAIITSGGVSQGTEDYIIQFLNQNQLYISGLLLKPGRPFAFGMVGGIPWFGLPGNPLAVLAAFELLLRPALNYLQCGVKRAPKFTPAPAGMVFTKKAGRAELIRVYIRDNSLHRAPKAGAAMLSSLNMADGYIYAPSHITTIQRGDICQFYPLNF